MHLASRSAANKARCVATTRWLGPHGFPQNVGQSSSLPLIQTVYLLYDSVTVFRSQKMETSENVKTSEEGELCGDVERDKENGVVGSSNVSKDSDSAWRDNFLPRHVLEGFDSTSSVQAPPDPQGSEGGVGSSSSVHVPPRGSLSLSSTHTARVMPVKVVTQPPAQGLRGFDCDQSSRLERTAGAEQEHAQQSYERAPGAGIEALVTGRGDEGKDGTKREERKHSDDAASGSEARRHSSLDLEKVKEIQARMSRVANGVSELKRMHGSVRLSCGLQCALLRARASTLGPSLAPSSYLQDAVKQIRLATDARSLAPHAVKCQRSPARE